MASKTYEKKITSNIKTSGTVVHIGSKGNYGGTKMTRSGPRGPSK